MVILGIDPGLERIGYGLIRRNGSQLEALEYGLIETPRVEVAPRLQLLHERIVTLIQQHKPEHLATEKLLFSVNRTTAMDVAKALGCILLAAAQSGLEVTEYAPPQVKQAVVGHGSADKKQVGYMVKRLLALGEEPKPDDVADALAIAICHALRSRVSAAPFGANGP
jgi:crossover junction endodeoxyribonuclease RuvC